MESCSHKLSQVSSFRFLFSVSALLSLPISEMFHRLACAPTCQSWRPTSAAGRLSDLSPVSALCSSWVQSFGIWPGFFLAFYFSVSPVSSSSETDNAEGLIKKGSNEGDDCKPYHTDLCSLS